MREIKFRAWFCGEMHDEIVLMDHKYCIIDLGCPLNAGILDFLSHDDPDTPMKLMQYTGLRDKNGVEIYEGDIIQSKGKVNRGVLWHEQGLQWIVWGGDPEVPWIPLAHWITHGIDDLEVIGDIHENPELLATVSD